jgi:hypothetical protein
LLNMNLSYCIPSRVQGADPASGSADANRAA